MNISNGKFKTMNSNFGQGKEQIPTSHSMLRKIYTDFANKMENSDFSNSPRRYVVELEYVKNLLNSAKTHNLKEELSVWEQKKTEITQRLQEFGITVND